MSLTPKQALFVKEYLVDLSATQAAIRAGYSPRTAGVIGHQNLRKLQIAEAIEAAKGERAERLEISADRVLQEAAKIAFADPRDVMEWGPMGVLLKESSEISDDAAAAVAEVSQTVTQHGGTIRLKLHDKLPALDKLARHLGLFDEHVRVSVEHRLAQYTDDQLREIVDSEPEKVLAMLRDVEEVGE